MADYLTTDTELTSVANAIRTKGGTSASLVYPAGFISAIEAISTGTDVSDTTLTTDKAASGYYFYNASGTKVQGSLTAQAAQTITPTTTDQTIASGKYLTGVQTIKGDANLVAANIKKDVMIFSVTGEYEGGGGGNPTAEENDVIFIDYDGTIRYSYSAAEFANLAALPENPTHDGLTAQGWNWSLVEAKSYVASCGGLVIGQMYKTIDGKTKLHIKIEYERTITVYWKQTVAYGVTIDWGDGSSTTRVKGTGSKSTSHTYSSNGEFIILISCTSGTLTLGNGTNGIIGNSSIRLYCINIGDSTILAANVFAEYGTIDYITIPNTVTDIGNQAFYNCYNLSSLTIPSSVAILPTYVGERARMKYISIPNSITTIGNYVNPRVLRFHIGTRVDSIGDGFFYDNTYIRTITIGSVSSLGENCFRILKNIVELTLPGNLTSTGAYCFDQNYSMLECHFKSTTPPSLGSNSFLRLNSNLKIYVPAASLATYQSASVWSDYASIMVGE